MADWAGNTARSGEDTVRIQSPLVATLSIGMVSGSWGFRVQQNLAQVELSWALHMATASLLCHWGYPSEGSANGIRAFLLEKRRGENRNMVLSQKSLLHDYWLPASAVALCYIPSWQVTNLTWLNHLYTFCFLCLYWRGWPQTGLRAGLLTLISVLRRFPQTLAVWLCWSMQAHEESSLWLPYWGCSLRQTWEAGTPDWGLAVEEASCSL